MGLIGGVLQSVFAGLTTVLMSPTSFMQRPMRWLEAISKWRGVISGGPNFAYELCVRKATPEVVAGLDLLHLAGCVYRRRTGTARYDGSLPANLCPMRPASRVHVPLLRTGRGNAFRNRRKSWNPSGRQPL